MLCKYKSKALTCFIVTQATNAEHKKGNQTERNHWKKTECETISEKFSLKRQKPVLKPKQKTTSIIAL